MLTALVLELRALQPGPLPPFLGRAAQAAFLDLVRQVDPQLARFLHDDEAPRPYTVSTLWDKATLTPARRATPEGAYLLRITCLDEAVGRATEASLAGLSRPLDLDGHPFALVQVLRAGAHPWAGQQSPRELAAGALLDRPAPRQVGLRFLSPTTFHSGGRNLPLPLPGLVFGNLVDRWNAIAPLALGPEVRRYAEECLALTRYQLRTVMVAVAGGRQVGFVGECAWTALRPDPYWLRVVRALTEFAFFAGVGAKTAMGLGQIGSVGGNAVLD